MYINIEFNKKLKKEAKIMAMDKITFEKAKMIANKKGLKPGKVNGTEGIQFTKGTNNRLTVITWDEFEAILGKRKLAVYESFGWMKIMKE